jgi:uncharacterized membrane protein YhaH (DUF805 family)
MERFSYVLLALYGRIKRRTWLIFALSVFVAEEFTAIALGGTLFSATHPSGVGDPLAFFDDRAATVSALIFLWPSTALDIKRWHDLGKSGWYTLIAYGPLALILALQITGVAQMTGVPDPVGKALLSLFGLILLVYFIILAARKGTPLPNRFGPS